MGLLDFFIKKDDTENLDEASKVFQYRDGKIKLKDIKKRYGEGVEDFNQMASRIWCLWIFWSIKLQLFP